MRIRKIAKWTLILAPSVLYPRTKIATAEINGNLIEGICYLFRGHK